MRYNYTYLKDSAFLKEFDNLHNKTQHIKITILNFQEKAIKEIQGRVTGGNLNLDGGSAVRRTCNLSMIADDYDENLINVNNLLSMNKKVTVEIGFTNTTMRYKDYDILWFPLGLFVIINANCSHSAEGLSISLQLKDKMCLLNGECGGVLPASVVFHEVEYYDSNLGKYVIENPLIYQIIQELVNHYGNELLTNILINDVPRQIKQVVKWNGNNPLYILPSVSSEGEKLYSICSSTLPEGQEDYISCEKGKDMGFIYTDFTYPGELIGDAGNTVCNILDKIKNTLGNYEYYYDINGVFIFQEIKNYLNTTQATTTLNNLNNTNYVVDISKGKAAYTFDSSNLVVSYSNAPQYNMIKNDFVVWGVRENSEGLSIPIRYHLAIDAKPRAGNSYEAGFYLEEDTKIKKAIPIYPTLYSTLEDLKAAKQNNVFVLYKVGPEQGPFEYYQYDSNTYESYRKIQNEYTIKTIVTKDWRSEIYFSGLYASVLATETSFYYAELANEWPKLYDIENGHFYKEMEESGTNLDYFLDFIDAPSAAIGSLGIENIGRRSKIINDDSINCIFEPDIPDIVWIKVGEEDTEKNRLSAQGQHYIQVSNEVYKNIVGGGSFNSAFNLIRDLLYQHTSFNESITVVSQPIYYLEPNIRITVNDVISGIYGDYILKSFSIPLTINGTMTLSCIRALERI